MFLKALDEIYYNKNICMTTAESRGQAQDILQQWNKGGQKFTFKKNKNQGQEHNSCRTFASFSCCEKPERMSSPNATTAAQFVIDIQRPRVFHNKVLGGQIHVSIQHLRQVSEN